MIKEIISHTPVFAWPFLAYLIWGGWKSRKTHVVPLKALFIMPAIMFIWSIYANLDNTLLWALSITIGFWLGSLIAGRLPLRFDKRNQLIEIPGNWTPMILSLSIFSLRYILGTTYGLYPDLKGHISLLILENLATVVSGILLGRFCEFWRQSKTATHVALTSEK